MLSSIDIDAPLAFVLASNDVDLRALRDWFQNLVERHAVKFTDDGRRSGWTDDRATRCALAERDVEGIVGQGDIRRLIELAGQHDGLTIVGRIQGHTSRRAGVAAGIRRCVRIEEIEVAWHPCRGPDACQLDHEDIPSLVHGDIDGGRQPGDCICLPPCCWIDSHNLGITRPKRQDASEVVADLAREQRHQNIPCGRVDCDSCGYCLLAPLEFGELCDDPNRTVHRDGDQTVRPAFDDVEDFSGAIPRKHVHRCVADDQTAAQTGFDIEFDHIDSRGAAIGHVALRGVIACEKQLSVVQPDDVAHPTNLIVAGPELRQRVVARDLRNDRLDLAGVVVVAIVIDVLEDADASGLQRTVARVDPIARFDDHQPAVRQHRNPSGVLQPSGNPRGVGCGSDPAGFSIATAGRGSSDLRS